MASSTMVVSLRSRHVRKSVRDTAVVEWSWCFLIARSARVLMTTEEILRETPGGWYERAIFDCPESSVPMGHLARLLGLLFSTAGFLPSYALL